MPFTKITFFKRSSENAHHHQVSLPNSFNWRQTLHLPSRLQKPDVPGCTQRLVVFKILNEKKKIYFCFALPSIMWKQFTCVQTPVPLTLFSLHLNAMNNLGHGYWDKSYENSFVVPRSHKILMTPLTSGMQSHTESTICFIHRPQHTSLPNPFYSFF